MTLAWLLISLAVTVCAHMPREFMRATKFVVNPSIKVVRPHYHEVRGN